MVAIITGMLIIKNITRQYLVMSYILITHSYVRQFNILRYK
jgi:hypothetical protein